MFFEKMQTRKNDGFTLVELIVVIAILAILAGIGVPAYTGYVEKANIVADQTLVGEVANALTLQYYSDSKNFVNGTSVALSKTSSAQAHGSGEAAMEAVFGAGWADTVKLTYSGWGSGGATSQAALDHLGSLASTSNTDERTAALQNLFNGNATPSFAEDVDDLFGVIRDTAITVGKSVNTTGAGLLGSAAQLTLGTTNTNMDSADEFAKQFGSGAWNSDLLVTSGSYTEDAIENAKPGDALLDQAIANAAVIKARNTSIATWLNKNGGSQYYDAISNYNMGSTGIPADILGDAQEALTDTTKMDAFCQKILGPDYTEPEAQEMLAAFGKVQTEYFPTTPDNITSSQAYKDGLAYYAMLDTVKSVEVEQDDETYWNNMSGAVSLYGAVASGSATISDLQAAYANVSGDVVVTAVVTADGVKCVVSPTAAYIAG